MNLNLELLEVLTILDGLFALLEEVQYQLGEIEDSDIENKEDYIKLRDEYSELMAKISHQLKEETKNKGGDKNE